MKTAINGVRLQEIEQVARIAQERIVVVYPPQPLYLGDDQRYLRFRGRVRRSIHEYPSFQSIKEQKYISDVRSRVLPPIDEPRQICPTPYWRDIVIARPISKTTLVRG